jgi:hypothetical protein
MGRVDTKLLGLKLLETLHLSVPERQQLPSSGLPFSSLVAGIRERLSRAGWFPEPRPTDEEFWTGARIELRGTELWVHERHEIGVMRVGPVQSSPAYSVEDAARRFIKVLGGEPIDGVHVDFRA